MINAYAAYQAREKLKPFHFELKALKPLDVRVKISHCGICYSDIHLLDNDWLITKFPFVPGHEIVGTVEAVGPEVSDLKVGDRVGIGWQSGACSHCHACDRGEENLCSSKIRTCVEQYGGFAEKITADHRFVYRIPDTLSSENAAPLLCAGITVYTPFRHYEIQAPQSVAIVGIGGLGHLALQFGRAFGCAVTALSSSPDKEAEARELGASDFICLNDPKAISSALNRFDFILSTAHGDLDWDKLLSLVKPKGRLCLVGYPQGSLKINPRLLISGNRTICGSGTGSRQLMEEMLLLAARQSIVAKTELFTFDKANEAIAKMRSNQIRYRAVLEVFSS